jgi:hypothetical protein
MGKVLECISKKEEEFILKQKVFFVGTAPLSADHHINVSPKAPGNSVIVLDPHTVVYGDLTGSGAETASHVLENERMTLMFCNLEEGLPIILRLYGKATLIVKEEVPRSILDKLPKEITTSHGFRGVYVLKVDRISSSCGYSLPVMKYEKQRKTLEEYTVRAVKEGDEGLTEYCLRKNSFSIDGLPSLALVRYPDKTIVQDEQDGYVFGKEIDGDADPDTTTFKTVVKKKSSSSLFSSISQEGIVMLTVGTLLGSVITSVCFSFLRK